MIRAALPAPAMMLEKRAQAARAGTAAGSAAPSNAGQLPRHSLDTLSIEPGGSGTLRTGGEERRVPARAMPVAQLVRGKKESHFDRVHALKEARKEADEARPQQKAALKLEAQEARREKEEARQRKAERERAKQEAAEARRQQEEAARRDPFGTFRLPHDGSLKQQLSARKQLTRRLGITTHRDFKAGTTNLDGWHKKKPGIIGAQHKFPKRTLAYLHEHMTPDQKIGLADRLYLPRTAGVPALARLRSNLIPIPEHIPDSNMPDRRLDDPEHTGEGLDLVTDETGTLTPRSREYAGLGKHAVEIGRRLEALKKERSEQGDHTEPSLTDEEAETVTGHLRRAEEWHQSIEGSGGAADYGDGLWRTQGRGTRVYFKGPAPSAKFTGKQRNPEGYEEAQRQRIEERKEADRQRVEQERREKLQQEARERDKWSTPRTVIGKSARFW